MIVICRLLLAIGLLCASLLVGCDWPVKRSAFLEDVEPLPRGNSIGMVFYWSGSRVVYKGPKVKPYKENMLCVVSEFRRMGPEIRIVETDVVLAALGLSHWVLQPYAIQEALHKDQVRKEIEALSVRYIIDVFPPSIRETAPGSVETYLQAWIIDTSQRRIVGNVDIGGGTDEKRCKEMARTLYLAFTN